ncbi:serine hydrolase domain-containing protein [Nocardioides ferulae]|uniref:serine hydrolase domain-containing protein n=1 Tax=Nocardioides ferulae TaxID=2340821 RepID=UPI000EB57D6F|nr:serine hydrolase domain-containing protein [Nocardioides ferulae]
MEVNGSVDERFAGVREVMADVVDSQPGTGASCAVWHDGAWVVDLWGGYADAERTRPWQRDTLVMPYSVTKPFAAVAVLTLVERGLVDLDAPMQRYWPELRAVTTVREVLAHRAGVVALDADASEEAFYDWELMCSLLADQEPSWAPGTAHGESALFYGHLLGEVVRRVDGRSLGRFLREEVCGPLGLDFHVGLGDAEVRRVADLTGFSARFQAAQQRGTDLYLRGVNNPPGARDPRVVNSERWRRAEVPAVNGHGTARAVAGLYAALAQGRLLTDELRGELARGHGVGPDQMMGDDRAWGLGVIVDDDGFGMGGLGGSLGWWSEVGGYAIAFLTGHIGGYGRADRIEGAVRESLGLPPL